MGIRTIQLETGLEYDSVVKSLANADEYPSHVVYDADTGIATKYFADKATVKNPPPDPVDPKDIPDSGDTAKDLLKRLDIIIAQLDNLIDDVPTDTNPGQAPFWKKWLGLG